MNNMDRCSDTETIQQLLLFASCITDIALSVKKKKKKNLTKKKHMFHLLITQQSYFPKMYFLSPPLPIFKLLELQ